MIVGALKTPLEIGIKKVLIKPPNAPNNPINPIMRNNENLDFIGLAAFISVKLC